MNSGQLNYLVIPKTVHLLVLSQTVLASLLSPQLNKPILLQRTENSYPPPSLFKGTESWKRRRCGEKCVSKRELIWALHSNSRRMTVFADTGATLNSLKIKSNKANIQVVRLPGGNGLSDYNLCGKVVPWPFLPLYVYCSTGRSKVHWLLAPKMKLNQTLRAMIVKRLHLQDKKCIFSRAREMKEIIF